MAVVDHELFMGPDGVLYIVKRDAMYGYRVFRVTSTPIRSYQRKYQAVEAIRQGEADPLTPAPRS